MAALGGRLWFEHNTKINENNARHISTRWNENNDSRHLDLIAY